LNAPPGAIPPRVQRWLTPTRWLPVVVFCLIVGAGGWVFTTIEPAADDARADVWKLPILPGAETASPDKAAALRSIWGTVATAAKAEGPTAPLTPPDWRILATAVSGTERVAMIRVGTEAPQELRVGDSLPGGAIIQGV
jgi:hypothetical protein